MRYLIRTVSHLTLSPFQKFRHASLIVCFVLYFVVLFTFSHTEIQYNHIFASGAVPAVPILFELVLFNNGYQSIYTGRSYRLFIYLLGSAWFCANGDDLSGSRWRLSTASAWSWGQFTKISKVCRSWPAATNGVVIKIKGKTSRYS